MRKILKEIQSGRFARQWIRESASGTKNFRRLLKADLRHPIERVGEKLRARMPWLQGAR
jgi:ketol-acid reductoisomerase